MSKEDREKAYARACTLQMCHEAGLKVSAEIVRNLGGKVPVVNPYSRAVLLS